MERVHLKAQRRGAAFELGPRSLKREGWWFRVVLLAVCRLAGMKMGEVCWEAVLKHCRMH